MNSSLTLDSWLFMVIFFLFQFLTKKSSNSTVVGSINATEEFYRSNALLERCIKMNKIKYRFKLVTKFVWKVIKFLCDYVRSHGQQSLLVGICLRENHRQIKSCLPHLPDNRKNSGDFAESREQVTSSCFKWQKRPQYTRTQASPSPCGMLGSKWQTIQHCIKSFFVLWKYCFSVTSKQSFNLGGSV